MATGSHHVRQNVDGGIAVVGAAVAQNQQRTARREHIVEVLGERDESVAVIGMPVTGVDAGLTGDALNRDRKIGIGTEQVRHLVGGVDEREDANARELLAQRVHEQQGEVTEPGHRTGYIAEHHQFRPRRPRLAQHQVDRHAAGRHRLPQRLAQVDRAGPGPAPPGREPGCQGAGQRGHYPPHLPHLIARSTQELDVLGQLRDTVGLDVFAA